MKKDFNPLIFLAPLGAGWLAVMPFAFMNYTVAHPKWLIALEHILPLLQTSMWWLYYFFMAIMVVFGVLHFALMIKFFVSFVAWNKTPEAKEYSEDPLRNVGITVPILGLAMTMNVFIGVIRFFVPVISENLQSFMLPALIAWWVLWIITMFMTIRITRNAFIKNFDFEKITFSWLLLPMTIGMVSVVGAGIAALAKDSTIASTAVFFTFMSAVFWLFLFVTKLITLFQKHFADKNGLPMKQALPSFLIVIPNITIYAITLFRLWHYFGNQTGHHVDFFLWFVIIGGFVFETRYLIFGISLLKDYLKGEFIQKDFHLSMRGLVCPIVGYVVLGGFAYQQFFNNPIIYWVSVAMAFLAVVTYAIIAKKHLGCKFGKVICD